VTLLKITPCALARLKRARFKNIILLGLFI
jgi:hypothetical protein